MAAPEGAQRAPILRSARPGDQTFLRAMLFEAAFWRPCEPRPAPTEALSDPKLARYVGLWGRPGDAGFVALDSGAHPIGAAWYRLFSSEQPGYGYNCRWSHRVHDE